MTQTSVERRRKVRLLKTLKQPSMALNRKWPVAAFAAAAGRAAEAASRAAFAATADYATADYATADYATADYAAEIATQRADLIDLLASATADYAATHERTT